MVEITIRKRPRNEAVITQRKFFKKTARGKVVKGVCNIHSIRPAWDMNFIYVKSFAKDTYEMTLRVA
jgi:hypothetical protein